MATTSIRINLDDVGMVGFTARVQPTAKAKAKDDTTHRYHAECNERLNQRAFCVKCNRIVSETEVKKGAEEGGKVVFFTQEDIDGLKTASGIYVVGMAQTTQPEPRTIKAVYQVLPSNDKKTGKTDALFYDAFRDVLKTGSVRITSKLRSAGYKQGSENAMFRYNPEYDTIELVHQYYTDELLDYAPVPEDKSMTAQQRSEASQFILQYLKPDTPIPDAILTNEHAKKREALIEAKLTNTTPTIAPTIKATDTAEGLIATLKVLANSKKSV
jgi:non-homologous end joining protein Ku